MQNMEEKTKYWLTQEWIEAYVQAIFELTGNEEEAKAERKLAERGIPQRLSHDPRVAAEMETM